MRVLDRLKTLIAGQKPADLFEAEILPRDPFYVVGDVHGCLDLLEGAIARIKAQDNAANTPVVFVGDYVDRGPDSAGVLKTLRNFQAAASGQVICLMGNHEDMLTSFLTAPSQSARLWLRNGGDQTLRSFGVQPPAPDAADDTLVGARDDLLAAMGGDLANWVRDLPMMWNTGNVTVVHAGADPNAPLEKQSGQTFLWGHRDFMKHPRQDGRWIVHGHTIVAQITARDGRIGVDTGAYLNGSLPVVKISGAGVETLPA